MIDWWGVVHNSFWVLGLAGALAAWSMASYQARVEKTRLRQKLNESGFQIPFNAAMILFCLGLLFSGRSWWEKVIWGLLAALFAGQVLWLWRRQVREKQAPYPDPPSATTATDDRASERSSCPQTPPKAKS